MTYPLMECLRTSQRYRFEFFGVDTQADLIAPGLAFRAVPEDDSGFVGSVAAWCSEADLDCIIPLIEEDLIRLKRASSPVAARVLGTSAEQAAMLSDKAELFTELQRSAPHLAPVFIAIERLSDLPGAARALGYPARALVLKPCRARGARGALRLSAEPIRDWAQGALPQYTPEFLVAHVDPASCAAWVVMPEAPGADLSIYAYAVAGRTVVQVALERGMASHGVTWSGKIVTEAKVAHYISAVTEALGVDSFVNFQLRWDGTRASLYEANPRLSGSTSIAALAGVNFPEILVTQHLDGRFDLPPVPRSLRFRRVVHALCEQPDEMDRAP